MCPKVAKGVAYRCRVGVNTGFVGILRRGEGNEMRKSTYLVMLAVVVWSCGVGNVHFLKAVVQLAGSGGRG
jgi:hypothetical protein